MNNEIQTLLDTYQRALNDANLDLVRQVYSSDAMVIGQPFPTATGIDAIWRSTRTSSRSAILALIGTREPGPVPCQTRRTRVPGDRVRRQPRLLFQAGPCG